MDKERFKVPKSVQQAIPIQRIWPDGIFQQGTKFSKTYRFTDINYYIASKDNKTEMFLDYSELLNSLDSGISAKITINNRRINKEEFEKSILLPMKEDGLDHYREEYNEMLLSKITGTNNSIYQERYLTVSVHKRSIDDARTYFARIGTDIVTHLAKLSSRKDDYDTGLWEHFSHLLAKKAGIHAAETKVIFTNDKYHTLLSRRFDRKEDGKRIHFASAMTLLGLNDGDNANTGHGYLDIVDFILQNCTNVEDNLQELYHRVAFNICIGNSDDHFRNHGFLLTAKGWTLAPAYDMNPTQNEYQSLLINSYTNKSDLNELLASCEEYMLPKQIALQIIGEVLVAVKDWQILATQLGIAKNEQKQFSTIFEHNLEIYDSK